MTKPRQQLLIKILATMLATIMCAALLLGYLLLGPVPAQNVSVTFDQSNIRFAAFGDQGTGNYRQWQIAQALNAVAAERGLDFIVLLGDNFYRHGVTGTDDWQWRYKFENMYRGAHLRSTPFYATLGNHDHYGDAEAQIDYDRDNLGSTRWQMPARDYIQHYGLAPDGQPLLRIAFIDTSPGARPLAETANVLDTLLTTSKPANWTVVASHAPLRSSRDFYDHEPLRSALMPALSQHAVDMFVAGHDHNLQVLQKDGEPLHVIAGSGGKYGQSITPDHDNHLVFAGFSLGFSYIEVTTEQLVLDIIDDRGEVQFSYVMEQP